MKPTLRWWEYVPAAAITALALALVWWLMGRPVELIRAHVPDQPDAPKKQAR